MAKLYEVHPDNPQSRTVDEIVRSLQRGAVMLYPTDTVYAIGCDLASKGAIERVRQIKQLANDKPLTFLCASLSDIATYAIVSDPAYRLMKRCIPGPYTFILPATKLVPKLVYNPKRKTTGIRVPDHPLCQALLQRLGNPLISTSAYARAGDEEPELDTWTPVDKARLFDYFDNLIDLTVDDGSLGTDREPVVAPDQLSTILDMTSLEPQVIRQGMGWAEIEPWLA
jgi:tRNA threonylcarbamoyl adenosine modification protein (Sua5/YciO/YrdC/YwlC family)